MSTRNPMYLGDGVYAQIDECNNLILTTGCHDAAKGQSPTNRIHLESFVMDALFKYCRHNNLRDGDER